MYSLLRLSKRLRHSIEHPPSFCGAGSKGRESPYYSGATPYSKWMTFVIPWAVGICQEPPTCPRYIATLECIRIDILDWSRATRQCPGQCDIYNHIIIESSSFYPPATPPLRTEVTRNDELTSRAVQ